jgi:hypothetical protein
MLDSVRCDSDSRRYPEVLVLYRKREDGRRSHEHGVFARFRYNDLKEDAGGLRWMRAKGWTRLTAMGIESFFVRSLLILLDLGKSEKYENRS